MSSSNVTNVSFSYPIDNHPILDLNPVKQNTTVAVSPENSLKSNSMLRVGMIAIAILGVCLIAVKSINLFRSGEMPETVKGTSLKGKALPSDSILRKQIMTAIEVLNTQYKKQEARDPREGYIVEFYVKSDHLEPHLIPSGNTRTSAFLSGVEAAAKKPCPFCPHALANNPGWLKNSTRLKTTEAVRSNSGQLLIIPTDHYAHWFDTPENIQADLLEETLEMREKYPKSKAHPIVLHCGERGFQGVFHTHIRSGIML